MIHACYQLFCASDFVLGPNLYLFLLNNNFKYLIPEMENFSLRIKSGPQIISNIISKSSQPSYLTTFCRILGDHRRFQALWSQKLYAYVSFSNIITFTPCQLLEALRTLKLEELWGHHAIEKWPHTGHPSDRKTWRLLVILAAEGEAEGLYVLWDCGCRATVARPSCFPVRGGWIWYKQFKC